MDIFVNCVLKIYGHKNRLFLHVHKGIPLQTQGRHIDKQEQHTRREDQREYMYVHSLPLPAPALGVCLPFLVVNQKRESKELHCLLCSLLYISARPHGGKAFVSI